MNPPGPDTVQEMTDQGHSVNTHWAGGPQSQGDSSIVYVQDGGGAPGGKLFTLACKQDISVTRLSMCRQATCCTITHHRCAARA